MPADAKCPKPPGAELGSTVSVPRTGRCAAPAGPWEGTLSASRALRAGSSWGARPPHPVPYLQEAVLSVSTWASAPDAVCPGAGVTLAGAQGTCSPASALAHPPCVRG